jgi:di/tricarboxylate transporter
VLQLFLLAGITLAALVLFVGGWLAVDLVGLLVFSALALTGLVGPEDALAGFSSPAVITVLAMFILSAGLSRTGVAYRLGKPLQRFARSPEWLLIVVLMAAASIFSALINTTTVAVILLPATMDLARRSGRPPSRLLLPMALGCLLGGPFTGISTPPNILVTDALRNAGLTPFAIFDFTPITGAIVLAGIVFVILAGRRLLPSAARGQVAASGGTEANYQFDAHVFSLGIRTGSPLAGRTLVETRLGSALQLTVVALRRGEDLHLAPRPDERLQEGDVLVVHGPVERFRHFHGSKHLRATPGHVAEGLAERLLLVARGVVGEGSALAGQSLAESSLRREHRVHVLALDPAQEPDVPGAPGAAPGPAPVLAPGSAGKDMAHRPLAVGDALTLLAEPSALAEVARLGLLAGLETPARARGEHAPAVPVTGPFMSLHVPPESALVGVSLADSHLGNKFGLTVVGIYRDEALHCMPEPGEVVQGDDVLVLHGSGRDFDVLRSLQDLAPMPTPPSLAAELESQRIGATEILLSPRTTLTGKTLADLRFRERYGLSVLALWRGGKALRTGLQELPLQFGDAMLVYGSRKSLEAVSRDADFLVLDQEAAQAPRLEKAPLAAVIMLAVILSAILGLAPIAITALAGSALMVLFRCLSMEEAYRAIEWKVIFLIACMLPLGVAVEHTGAARMGAEVLIATVGGLGPRWVVAALFLVTVLGTQVIPTAALVVLMAPVALSAAADLGISPHLLMMTVAMAASASFASPLSHPAHLLVMGPGGYRFTDYLRVGIPLTVVVMAVSVWLLPILWPA